ncbi:MAG: NAD(P)H:quinone oxidoreductase, partial [Verrucomicrobia bacterium]|nr:NAD(P)H:quinone oxidoreductase [Verrucomicrobiota bacterium]
MSTKVYVVFYSTYGHVYKMAESVAAGAGEVAGVEVKLFQVPELMSDAALEKSGAKAARQAF